ncbi:hypothetical protein SAMN05444274_11093 [Mariniphaga anaerophila]|uniref:Uncharacterized protein n=1 Tax=Mariniphaga anaerophila TaxID=1484053 RepID=A0A1M5EZE1_9BACT|nr:hypothetical protein SAMN05444274_11093 [Mariniphaga anaerophila]
MNIKTPHHTLPPNKTFVQKLNSIEKNKPELASLNYPSFSDFVNITNID